MKWRRRRTLHFSDHRGRGPPAVYSERRSITAGGLISYGPDRIEQFRRAAGYADRVLKGEKPGDLPVQAPTKYELVINRRTDEPASLRLS